MIMMIMKLPRQPHQKETIPLPQTWETRLDKILCWEMILTKIVLPVVVMAVDF